MPVPNPNPMNLGPLIDPSQTHPRNSALEDDGSDALLDATNNTPGSTRAPNKWVEAAYMGLGPLSGLFAQLGAQWAGKDRDMAFNRGMAIGESIRQVRQQQMQRAELQRQARLREQVTGFNIMAAAGASKTELRQASGPILVAHGLKPLPHEIALVSDNPIITKFLDASRANEWADADYAALYALREENPAYMDSLAFRRAIANADTAMERKMSRALESPEERARREHETWQMKREKTLAGREDEDYAANRPVVEATRQGALAELEHQGWARGQEVAAAPYEEATREFGLEQMDEMRKEWKRNADQYQKDLDWVDKERDRREKEWARQDKLQPELDEHDRLSREQQRKEWKTQEEELAERRRIQRVNEKITALDVLSTHGGDPDSIKETAGDVVRSLGISDPKFKETKGLMDYPEILPILKPGPYDQADIEAFYDRADRDPEMQKLASFQRAQANLDQAGIGRPERAGDKPAGTAMASKWAEEMGTDDPEIISMLATIPAEDARLIVKDYVNMQKMEDWQFKADFYGRVMAGEAPTLADYFRMQKVVDSEAGDVAAKGEKVLEILEVSEELFKDSLEGLSGEEKERARAEQDAMIGRLKSVFEDYVMRSTESAEILYQGEANLNRETAWSMDEAVDFTESLYDSLSMGGLFNE